MYKNIETIATAGNTSPTSGTKMLGKSVFIDAESPLYYLRIVITSISGKSKND